MFKKILIPLDGSQLAECALSYAEELALISKVEKVTLISVTERIKGATFFEEAMEAFNASDDAGLGRDRRLIDDPFTVTLFPNINPASPVTVFPAINADRRGVSIVFGKMEKQAQKYLNRIAEQFEKQNIPVSTEVLIGNVAEQITTYAEENLYDVIVMSSHGRSGPSRWTYGSVTDKVFRSACIPLLIVRAPGCFPDLKKKTKKKK